jgi:hypothetical protein
VYCGGRFQGCNTGSNPVGDTNSSLRAPVLLADIRNTRVRAGFGPDWMPLAYSYSAPLVQRVIESRWGQKFSRIRRENFGALEQWILEQ